MKENIAFAYPLFLTLGIVAKSCYVRRLDSKLLHPSLLLGVSRKQETRGHALLFLVLRMRRIQRFVSIAFRSAITRCSIWLSLPGEGSVLGPV